MFPKGTNSFLDLTKQRKNGEQPSQIKRAANPVFSKKRPLAEIQYETFTVDFPEDANQQAIFSSGKPIFETLEKKELNLTPSKANPVPTKPLSEQEPVREVSKKAAPSSDTNEKMPSEKLVILDANSQGFKVPSLEHYSRYKHQELARHAQTESANQILDNLAQFGFDDLTTQKEYQFHHNMIQATSLKQNTYFQECQIVTFLKSNLICAVKGDQISITNLSDVLYQRQAQSPVKHVFFSKDILYVSTTDELITVKLSESSHTGLKFESEQIIGVSFDNIINTSAIVNNKIWVGMSQAQELKVESKKTGLLFCKNGTETAVKLPRKSFISKVTSFFTSKDKVTQLYDIPSIDLSVAFQENSTKYSASEVQFFDRKSLKMCGKFTVEWLVASVKSFLIQSHKSYPQLNVEGEIILVDGKFYNYKHQRQVVITLSSGVRINLYIAPPRSQNGAISIGEDDISVCKVESCSVEGCLAQLGMPSPTYQSPLISSRNEIILSQPFKKDFSIEIYTIICAKSSGLLSTFIIQQGDKLILITELQQQNQIISSMYHLKGQQFFDMAIEDQQHCQTIKILTSYGLEQFQQKTLRDHIGSYLHLASQVQGGLANAQQLGQDFEHMLAQYPLKDILVVLVDFLVSDEHHCQPIYHDIGVQNFYFNQTQPPGLTPVRLPKRLKQESFHLFELLLKRMREQFDKNKWALCCDVIDQTIFCRCERLLKQYPFRTRNEGVSPELVKESLIVLEHLIEFLQHLKCEDATPSIQFCCRLREVCSFIVITMSRINWDVSVILSQVFEEDQKLVKQVNIQELVSMGLDSPGLQIFLENYITFHKHNQRIRHELTTQCCSQFLNEDFLILSEARQKLVNSNSTKEEIKWAVHSLCKHVNKTDLFATFDLLIENFQIYGLDPSVTYLQCFIETKFVHLQWCQANQIELTTTDLVNDQRLQAMDILLEMVEELGLRIQSKSKDQPQSKIGCINQFRQKLLKIQQLDQLQLSLTYLVLRVEKIEDQSLHNGLFSLLINLGLPQYIRQSSSKHLITFFKDKKAMQGETTDSVQITSDNLILLGRFEDCFQYLIEVIGSSRYFDRVERPTAQSMPIQSRLVLLQKAEVCLDKLESGPQKLKWQTETKNFKRLISVQLEVSEQFTYSLKAKELSEEEQFIQKQLQQDLFSADELIETCNQNLLFVEMLQAILLKVSQSGVPHPGFTNQEIEDQVLMCYEGLIKINKAEDIPGLLQTLHQINQLSLGNQPQQVTNLVRGRVVNQLRIDFFPLHHILASAVNNNKVTDALMNLLHQYYPLSELIDLVLRIRTPNNNALTTLFPIIDQLAVSGCQLADSRERNQLEVVRDLLVEEYIKQEMRYTVQVVNQSVKALADIEKLISL